MSVLAWQGAPDWLTVTLVGGSMTEEGAQLAYAAEQAVKHQGGKYEERPFSSHGFRGVQRGSVVLARKDDNLLLQVSSDAAAAAARCLPTGGLNIPRLDLAVTVWFDNDDMERAIKALPGAVTEGEKIRGKKKRRVRLEYAPGQGDTLYLGAPSSNQRGRLYDKWRESGDGYYAGAWRWEVQLRNERAEKAWPVVAGKAECHAQVSSVVKEWWESRGVGIPIPFCCDIPTVAPVARPRPDDTRRLAWLADQVRPCILGLIDRLGPEVVYSKTGIRIDP